MLRVFEIVPYSPSPDLVPYVLLPFLGVRRRTRHDNFENTYLVISVIPSRPEFHNLIEEFDTNPPRHTDNNPLPFKDRRLLFEVVDNVLRYSADPLRSPGDSLDS